MTEPRVHELKTPPPYFADIAAGVKRFDIRRNDRAFQTGDVVVLREWHPIQVDATAACPLCGYWHRSVGHFPDNGPTLRFRIVYVYSGDPRYRGVEPGFVVLGYGPELVAPPAAVTAAPTPPRPGPPPTKPPVASAGRR